MRCAKFLCKINLRRYCCQDIGSDFILNCEALIDMSVISFSPELAIDKPVHQPYRDSYAIAQLVETTFQQVPHPKTTRDLPGLESLAAAAERGNLRSDRKQ